MGAIIACSVIFARLDCCWTAMDTADLNLPDDPAALAALPASTAMRASPAGRGAGLRGGHRRRGSWAAEALARSGVGSSP
jgi:hypothetical protein